MKKKVVLIITDGIGYKKCNKYNAFAQAKKRAYNYLFDKVPHSFIKSYGLSVGLPNGQMGNSEVGHMSIGSGRVLYQDLVKISMAVENKTLAKNEVLDTLLSETNNIHIVGLMSDGGVHSHITHLIEVAKIAEINNKKVFLHLITDGRDVSPTSAKIYIEEIEKNIDKKNIKIASISGRFYTMDRDNRWERVKEGYDAIINATPKTNLTPKEYINSSYSKDITDEFIKPISLNSYDGAKDGDGFIFINFRSDRVREIVTTIGDKNFTEFESSKNSFKVITMTEYNKSFNYPVMFKKEPPKNTLAEVVSNANLTQLHTAETEKYAHVTFFLNGGVDEPFKNEERILIPSPKVKTYDLQPEMSAKEVGEVVLGAMDSDKDLIIVNFANGDMVGHTGNIEAGIKAVETVDSELEKIIAKAKKRDYSLVITSDHGNCEQMRDENGKTLTNHTVGDVWCFVMDERIKKLKDGGLDNIAPTVLKLMGLEIPSEMNETLF